MFIDFVESRLWQALGNLREKQTIENGLFQEAIIMKNWEKALFKAK